MEAPELREDKDKMMGQARSSSPPAAHASQRMRNNTLEQSGSQQGPRGGDMPRPGEPRSRTFHIRNSRKTQFIRQGGNRGGSSLSAFIIQSRGR